MNIWKIDYDDDPSLWFQYLGNGRTSPSSMETSRIQSTHLRRKGLGPGTGAPISNRLIYYAFHFLCIWQILQVIFIWILLVINSSLENSLYIRRYKAYHKSGHCSQAAAGDRISVRNFDWKGVYYIMGWVGSCDVSEARGCVHLLRLNYEGRILAQFNTVGWC